MPDPRVCAAVAFLAVALAGTAEAQDFQESDINGSWKVEIDKQVTYMKEADKEVGAFGDEQLTLVRQFLTGVKFTFGKGEMKVNLGSMAGKDREKKAMLTVLDRKPGKWLIQTRELDDKGKPRDKKEKGEIEWKDKDHIRIHGELENPKSVFFLVRDGKKEK